MKTEDDLQEIVSNRRVILGPTDNIKSMDVIKYPWATELFKRMQHNEWLSSSVKTLYRDKDTYHTLNPGTQLGYKRALAFLTNLDGLQVENLTHNVVEHVTDFNIQMCMYRQIYEEANHVEAYAKIISTVFDNTTEIYLMHETDTVLAEKNEFILAQANAMQGEFSAEKFIYAVVSNIILEGIYFHSGFLLFYVIARLQGKMNGSSDMVKYIQRDETTHCELFTNMFNVMRSENADSFSPRVIDNIYNLFDKGVNLEIAWGKHLIEQGVPGLSEENISQYIKCLGNERLEKIHLDKMYPNYDPFPWVAEFKNPNNADKNFFESTVDSYTKKKLGNLF